MKHPTLPRALTLALALAAATFGPLLTSGSALAETSKEGDRPAAENAKESTAEGAKPAAKDAKAAKGKAVRAKSKKAAGPKASSGHKKGAKAHKQTAKSTKAKRSGARETKPATKRAKPANKADDAPKPSSSRKGEGPPSSATKAVAARPAKAGAHGETKVAAHRANKAKAHGETKVATYSETPPSAHRTQRSRRAKGRSAKRAAPCVAAPISIDRAGVEADHFPLVDCNNRPLAAAISKVSVLSRPWGAPKTAAAKTPSIDAEVVARLNAIAAKLPGHTISVVGGPSASGKGKSAHEAGRALDLRMDGVENDALIAVCRSLPDTGCGYYPNAAFIHIDARPKGAGKVFWIDASEPGSAPRYVTSWPPK